MILDEQEVLSRFESPLNLLNRLKSSLSKPSHRPTIVSIPPTADKIVDNLEDKLKSGGLKTKAAAIMDTCLEELKSRIQDIEKPEKLAAIAAEMNKVITAENKNKDNDKTDMPQFVIYSPQIISEENFQTIYVKE